MQKGLHFPVTITRTITRCMYLRAAIASNSELGPKANLRRRHALPAKIRRALERWLVFRGDAPGPLFNPVNKGGRVVPRRLSQQAIYIACQKRASEAGLPPTSPEDLRRAAPEA